MIPSSIAFLLVGGFTFLVGYAMGTAAGVAKGKADILEETHLDKPIEHKEDDD